MTARTKYLEPIASEEVIDLIQTADSIPTRNLAIANEAPAQRLHANVLGVQVEALDMAAALSRIETALIIARRATSAWPACMELWRLSAIRRLRMHLRMLI